MYRVIVHYPFIPSYRIPVFTTLSQERDIDLVVFAAKKSNDLTLLSEQDSYNFRHERTELKTQKLFGKNIEFELGVVKRLYSMKGIYKYYVVLSNPNILSSWVYAVLAKVFGYHVIFWGHGLLQRDRGIKKFLRKTYYSLADGHWLYGHRGKDLMKELGISDEKMAVIFNSLDYNTQKSIKCELDSSRSSIRKKLGFEEHDTVLICMGRLLDKLKIDLAIKVVAEGKKRGEVIKLIIIGDGPERENIKNLSIELDVEDEVIFVGALYEEYALAPYYISADASVVMGIVGLSAMHSLAYGVPLITHNRIEEHCPEIEAIIPGSTGEFFEKDDLNSFMMALDRVKNNKNVYSSNCINVIENSYTPEKQVGHILEYLDGI
ncbi:glycosyltransferase [Citrobacter portucalensis]|uniref:glycosyltransferase n=1 Tax=Citrobacter portucalensis TaxID=1639133 RepID=UPI004034B3DF